MSKGKYVVPVVMGELGQEMYLINGVFPRDQKTALGRSGTRRAVLERDAAGVEKAIEKGRGNYLAPRYLTEIDLVTREDYRTGKHMRSEARVLEGFIRNTGTTMSKSCSELDGWFLVEKSGDLMPLKLAKFSINLLDDDTREKMVDSLFGR